MSRPPRRITVQGSLSRPADAAHPGFLGTGWSFPPTFTRQTASVAMVSGDVDIRESLWIILITRLGERVMLPTFGTLLFDEVFTALTATTAEEMAKMVSDAIIEWEPRVTVLDVAVTANDAETGRVDISIDYEVRQTNSRSNLVLPYYLLEATLSRPRS